MSANQEKHDGNAGIGGSNITNLRCADEITALAEKEGTRSLSKQFRQNLNSV